jgi:hypothetical protein
MAVLMCLVTAFAYLMVIRAIWRWRCADQLFVPAGLPWSREFDTVLWWVAAAIALTVVTL